MATELFYANPRQTEFSARVTDLQEDGKGVWVALDQTCFYPEGGGQPADRGWLDDIPVSDVQKRTDDIYHLVSSAPQTKEVKGRIDWSHRFDYMQQHTGQHVISAAFVHVGGHDTVSVRQGDEVTTVDIEPQSLSEEELLEVERRAQEAVFENRAVRDFEVTEDQVASLELRRPPKVAGTIRIVEIDGFDRVACGGVHAASTGEVGIIKLVGTERIRGNLRTVWKIGDRAREDYRLKHRVITSLVDLLSAKPEEIVERTRKFDSQLRDTEYRLGQLQRRLASAEAAQLRSAALQGGEPAVVTHAFESEEKSLFREIAEQLAETPGTLACITNRQGEQLLWAVAASEDQSLDFGAVKERLLPIIDGKGGGKAPLWQGAGRKPDGANEFLEGFRQIVGAR